jgi:hypothetical protein
MLENAAMDAAMVHAEEVDLRTDNRWLHLHELYMLAD